jgi:hypothetical protein
MVRPRRPPAACGDLVGAPSARSLLVGDRRSRLASRWGAPAEPLPPTPPAAARRVVLVVLLLAVLGAGCRLQLDVNVDVAEDGSGVVEVVVGLDADALRRIGGDLAAVMEVDDLVDAGWVVDEPATESDGFTRVRIRHRFDDPEQAARVFAQIAGEDGPFQDFAITRERSFAETTWGFTGRVDFSGGVAAFGDDGLAATLDGEPIGQSVEELERRLGDSLSRLIQVRVRARLPGSVTSNATTKAANGAVWEVGFGEGSVDLRATGQERRWGSLALAGVAGLSGVALLVVLLVRLAGRARRGSIVEDA